MTRSTLVEPVAPGDFTFFLSRATLSELLQARTEEVLKGMATRWRVVLAIDEELHHRNEAVRQALSSGDE